MGKAKSDLRDMRDSVELKYIIIMQSHGLSHNALFQNLAQFRFEVIFGNLQNI